MTIDWSYPTGSIGDHLCVLLDAPSIASLMHAEYDARLKQFLQPNGYVLYKTLEAQKIAP